MCRLDHILHLRAQHWDTSGRVTPEAAGWGYPQSIFANDARPVRNSLTDLFHRFNPIAALIDDAGGQFHAFRHTLERFAFNPLKEILHFEGSDVDNTLEPLKNVYPRSTPSPFI
jgi:hypothetical protein